MALFILYCFTCQMILTISSSRHQSFCILLNLILSYQQSDRSVSQFSWNVFFFCSFCLTKFEHTHSFIDLCTHWCHRGLLVPISSSQSEKQGIHPGNVASPSEDTHTILTFTPTVWKIQSHWPCMFLDCGRTVLTNQANKQLIHSIHSRRISTTGPPMNPASLCCFWFLICWNLSMYILSGLC